MRPSHHWSQIRAAFFDVDGTLVDSIDMVAHGLRDTMRHFCGVDLDLTSAKSLVGAPLAQQVERLSERPVPHEQLAEITGYALERFASYRHLERSLPSAIRAVELCRQSGLRTAAITSRNRLELAATWDGFEGADSIELVVSGDDVEHGKPAPDSAWHAARAFGLSPAECVFIGDSIYDARCAKAAGCPFVAVTYGSGTAAELRAESPNVTLETPEQLLAWVEMELLNLTCLERNR